MKKKRIAIFASGSGTNAEAIAKYFSRSEVAEVALILSNNSEAYVLTRADQLKIDSVVFDRKEFKEGKVLNTLRDRQIDFIVLAGFLWLVPKDLIAVFENKILNIHPSLLPKYGGKGMYGDRVHQAVIDAGENESGITIHLVDEIYDNGRILCQEKVKIHKDDNAKTLANKIHQLEHEFFPKTVKKYLLKID